MTAPVRPYMCNRTPAPKSAADLDPEHCFALVHFPHGFTTVATVAKALKVAIHELLHVTLMRFDMIDVSCLDAKSNSSAFPAPWFPDQLVGAAFLPAVSWIRVQVVPDGRLLPDGLRFVSWAVAFTGQHPAARMFTFSQRFIHAYILQTKQKAGTNNHAFSVSHWLRLSKHWPSWISINPSHLQSLQNATTFRPNVFWVILITRRFRLHLGHINQPFSTVSILSHAGELCKTCLFFCEKVWLPAFNS